MKISNRVFIAISVPFLFALLGFAAYGVYATFYAGANSGPNFLQALGSGSLSPSSIATIEVVDPPVGYSPFTPGEYAKLVRRATISDVPTINRLLSQLNACIPGRAHQNHPGTFNRTYLKVNVQGGFYWLYLEVLKDSKSSQLLVHVNTRNSTNPNRAATYRLENFAELLTLLQPSTNSIPLEPGATNHQ